MSNYEFRAWDKELKCMKPFDQLRLCDYNKRWYKDNTKSKTKINDMFTDTTLTLMLKTPVKDIKGTKLFAGDVLAGNIPTCVICFGKYKNDKEYADHAEGIGFYIKNSDGIDHLTQDMINIYELEKIGDIYSNPELNDDIKGE
jgi:uncharacterized phage protein (TIGR01671 family)